MLSLELRQIIFVVPESFWQLLSRRMAGEASIQELDELDLLIRHNPSLENFVRAFEKQTVSKGSTEAEAALAAQLVKMELSGRLQSQNKHAGRRYISKPVYITGAVLAAGLLLFLSFKSLTEGRNKAPTDIATGKNNIFTKKGAASRITLPDSTEVWLNGNSKLVYAENFGITTREVTLSGEGFFNVAKNPDKPFIIYTDKVRLKVLGTSFNVKSYPDDEMVKTSLIHGQVEVTLKDRPAEKIILSPNEKLVVRKNQIVQNKTGPPKLEINNMVFLKDSILEETAWVQNKLVFTDESFSEIAKQLERRFDVSLRFANEEARTFTYTGIFENETIDKILELMSLSRHFSYTIQGKTILITL